MITAIPTELTAQEIAEAIGKKRSRVFELATEQKWNYLEVIGKGGRKRKYIVGDLPEEVRLKVMKYYMSAVSGPSPIKSPQPPLQGGELSPKPRSNTPIQADLPPGVCPEGVPLLTPAYQPVQAGEVYSSFSSPRLNGQNRLPARAEEIARARADLVMRYVECTSALCNSGDESPNSKPSTTEAKAEFLEAYNTGLALPVLFQALGAVSRSTLERWRKEFEDANNDYTALAPCWGRHRAGESKITGDESDYFVAQLFHPNRIKVGTAIRVTKYLLEQKGLPSPSSPNTFRRFVGAIKKERADLWTLYREGEKALKDKILPYIERNINLIDVGDILVADGHRCNFFVHNPFNGKKCRPLLVGWYDWKSGKLVGYALGLEENTQMVAAALRMAIIRLGKLPKIAFMDNGKAFKSKVFTGDVDLLQCGLTGMFARLGIISAFATPYNAQSKPIERFFGDFGNTFERFMPSFCGGSIEDKPAFLLRNEKFMKQLHGEPVMDIRQVVQALESWLNFQSRERHPQIKNMTKGEVFDSGKGTGVDEAELRYLMMDMKIKTIRRNGIHFLDAHYFSEALVGLRDQVTIRYDFWDISKIFVYRLTGEFVCEAGRLAGIHPMASHLGEPRDVEEVQRRIKQRKSIERGIKKVAKQACAADGNLSRLDRLPWHALPEGTVDILEQVETEVVAPREWAKIPTVEPRHCEQSEAIQNTWIATPPAAAHDDESSKTGAEIVPLFTSRVEKYIYLSTKRQRTEEETLELEECKRAESVKDFMAMSRAVAQ